MFHEERFQDIRLSVPELLETETNIEFDISYDVFVFEETSGHIMRLNGQMYDSRTKEESIKGKDIKVGYCTTRIDNFMKALFEYLSDVLQFKLHRIGIDVIEDLEIDFELEYYDFLEHSYGQSNDRSMSNSVLASKYHIFALMPQPEFSSSYFLNVFNLNVWYAIVAIIFTSCVMLAVFKYFLKKFDIDCVETIYFTLGMADIRNYDRMNTSLRFTCVVLSLYMFLVMAAFSTFLTCELSAKDSKMPFHNLDEFRLQNEYGFCMSEYFEWLVGGNLGYSQKINGDNCPATYPPPADSELFESICNYNKSVFLIVDSAIYKELSTVYHGFPPCNIFKFTDEFTTAYSMILAKFSFKYRRQISLIMTKLRSSGCLLRMERTLIGDREMRLNRHIDSKLTSIEFDHVLLIYIIYFMTIISSLGAFISVRMITASILYVLEMEHRNLQTTLSSVTLYAN